MQQESSVELERLQAILVSLCGVNREEVLGGTKLAALGIDSLKAIELAKEIEAGFKISLSSHDIADMETFDNLCQSIPGCKTAVRHDSIVSVDSHQTKEQDYRSAQDLASKTKSACLENPTSAASHGGDNGIEHVSINAEQHSSQFDQYADEFTRGWQAPLHTRPLQRPSQACVYGDRRIWKPWSAYGCRASLAF